MEAPAGYSPEEEFTRELTKTLGRVLGLAIALLVVYHLTRMDWYEYMDLVKRTLSAMASSSFR